MSDAEDQLHAGELDAIPEPRTGDATWSVWRGQHRVGVLEQHAAGGAVWLTGRVDGDLVAEGPSPLSVLRRLDCRASTRRDETSTPSLVRT